MWPLLLLAWLAGAPTLILFFIVFVAKAGGLCDRMADRALARALPPSRAQVLGGPLDGLEFDLD
jgi:hypothetical protein